MDRVERSTDAHGNAYSLFQTAINLDLQVRARTEELTAVLHRLELSNEELRRAKEEAEQANLYKTRFLAAAGHDLLQPLNAARLTVSALTEVQTTEEGSRLAGQVDRALSSIEDLLKTLLDISQLDAGVLKAETKTVQLQEILSALASDFGPIVAKKGLAFRVRPTTAVVRTDPLLLRRVLQNLISNAIRYTPAGGVLVGVRPGPGAAARITVADTGIGIPPGEHELIFEEFHRGHLPKGDGSAGLGLGLAIVRRMVQALGHRLSFRSKEGRGTAFTVTVPLAAAEDVPVPAQETRAALKTFGVADAKVLVVENDDAVRSATEVLLARWSCRVSATRTVGEAADLVGSDGPPDLVLADYHLDNGETGLDAIERVRQLAGRPVPAVVVTADGGAAIARRVRGAGCELMQKPVKPAELRALMAHLLG
ncbi:hybrid sensor histidine kinase/response regulator [Chthonobacter rhizosphaerae]|uniref:hybrid sensor histidine kinase/response regulator n=1 Tax=Chthonobacter rhizosphaerae TaxID=2735553 RepID=UPI001FE7632D|nr:hybrid sensor histidine kinase/response regulator [Chthonobacter rhizosphaerae]